jgi:hypothetical protein
MVTTLPVIKNQTGLLDGCHRQQSGLYFIRNGFTKQESVTAVKLAVSAKGTLAVLRFVSMVVGVIRHSPNNTFRPHK